MNFLLPLLLIGTLHAANDTFGIPDWIIPSILMVETRSYYQDDGTIRYVDRRRGQAGDRGCTQITYAAFITVAHRGESFGRLTQDPAYAEQITARYLWWLYEHTAGKDWDRAVMQYNCGPRINRAGRRYLAKCKALWR